MSVDQIMAALPEKSREAVPRLRESALAAFGLMPAPDARMGQ